MHIQSVVGIPSSFELYREPFHIASIDVSGKKASSIHTIYRTGASDISTSSITFILRRTCT